MRPGQEEIQRLTLEELDKLNGKIPDDIFLKAVYASYPSVWMEHMLPDPHAPSEKMKLRWYQKEIVDSPTRKRILRIGRQAGKSLTLIAMALWRAICFPGAEIILVAPREAQIKSLFNMMKSLIASSKPALRRMLHKITIQPLEAVFNNGSRIQGYTVAKESVAAGGATIRGQHASDLFIDEADYIDDETMETAIMPVTTDYKCPFIWMSSTPTGRIGTFYQTWHGGEYTTYHFPSSVSPNWTPEKQRMVEGLPKAIREHEYEANWFTGETSVFKTELIETMQNVTSKIIFNGQTFQNYSYADKDHLVKTAKSRIIGVDWNKTHGTRIVCIVVDRNNRVCIINKKKIEFSDFTQHRAIEEIQAIDRWFNADYIAVDVGYGGMQIESIRMIPSLQKKLLPVETGGRIEILDPFTGDTRQTPIKNFIVNSTVRCLEQGVLTLPTEEFMTGNNVRTDSKNLPIADQMRNYYIEKIAYDGREIYACRSDHDLDAMMFAIHAYITQILKLNNLFDLLPLAKAAIVNSPGYNQVPVVDRDLMAENPVGKAIMNHTRMPTRSLNSIGGRFTGKRNMVRRSLGFSSRTRSMYGG